MVAMGVPVFPMPYTLMPWPIDTQIQMGFDFNTSQPDTIERMNKLLSNQPYTQQPKQYTSNSIVQLPQLPQLQVNRIHQQQPFKQSQRQTTQQQDTQVVNIEPPPEPKHSLPSIRSTRHSKKSKQSKESKSKSKKSKVSLKKQPKRMSTKQIRLLASRMMFIGYYMRTLRNEIAAKIQLCREIQSKTGDILDGYLELVEEAMEQPLLKFLNVKQDLKLELGQDSINQKKSNELYGLLLDFLSNLQKIKLDKLGATFYPFLNTVVTPYQFPPIKYYLKFEGDRLRFTHNGALGQLNTQQQRMVVLILVIIRVLSFALILQAWTFHPAQDNKEVLFLIQRNSIIVASVLQHILISEYGTEKIIKFNWAGVNADVKIEFVSQLTENEVNPQQQTLIKDLLPLNLSKQYIDLMQKDQKKYDKLTKLMTDYADTMLLGLQKYNTENGQPKQRMMQKINNQIFNEQYN